MEAVLEPAHATSAQGETDDAALLARYVDRGDREAMTELFRRHADMAYRVGLRCFGNAQDAADTVQAVFLEVLRQSGRYRGESSVKGWIMGIAYNCCKLHARERKRAKARELRAASAPAENAASENSDETRMLVRRAVDELPEHYRLPVWMHFLEGLALEEVAAALALPPNTVRSQLTRGLDKLRESALLRSSGLAGASLPAVLATVPLESAPAALVASLASLSVTSSVAGASAGAAKGAAAAKTGLTLKVAAFVAVSSLAAGGVYFAVKDSPRDEPAAKAAPSGDPEAEPKGAVAGPQVGNGPVAVGWRNDGTGQYPNAKPPFEWGRWASSTVNALNAQAQKPKDGAPPTGPKVRYGLITQWLALGPISSTDVAKDMDAAILTDEANVQPDEGAQAAGSAWKLFNREGQTNQFDLDVNAAFGKQPEKAAQIAYFHTYLYASEAGRVRLTAPKLLVKVWLNGQVVLNPTPAAPNYEMASAGLDLKKGWNRVLVKSGRGGGVFVLRPDSPPAYEHKNVVWMTKLPANNVVSLPIAAGDKLFLTSEPDELLCVNKADGKILWTRCNTYAAAASPEDRKANPDVFQKADALLDKIEKANAETLQAINANLAPGGLRASKDILNDNQKNAKNALRKELYDLLKPLNEKFDGRNNGSDFGFSVPTPCSDGQRVYVWFTHGVAACYDLEGKRLWATIENKHWRIEHGNCASPLLVGDRFIVLMDDMVAFDAKTGTVAWRQKRKGRFFGTPVAAKGAAWMSSASPTAASCAPATARTSGASTTTTTSRRSPGPARWSRTARSTRWPPSASGSCAWTCPVRPPTR